MKIFILFIAVISLIILFFASGTWRAVYTSGTWKYKLTLVVDDNGKQIVSSSVTQVYVQTVPRITPESTPEISVRGEAVVVDLGQKGVFFALLKNKELGSSYGYYVVFSEFPSELEALSPNSIRHYSQLKAKKELSIDKLPLLVRFRDIKDPKTVELIDPNNLEKTFGKGVKLVSATLEMTNDPLISRISDYITPYSWEKYGFTEWRSNLRYDQLTIDWSDFLQ